MVALNVDEVSRISTLNWFGGQKEKSLIGFGCERCHTGAKEESVGMEKETVSSSKQTAKKKAIYQDQFQRKEGVGGGRFPKAHALRPGTISFQYSLWVVYKLEAVGRVE